MTYNAKLQPSQYELFVIADSGIPLRDIFPDGIEVVIEGDDMQLLTPPDSRYKVIDGVVVRVDE